MKLVILDRDGVINYDSDAYIKTPDEWSPLPGSIEAIAQLHRAGYRIIVATNQSGVDRGLFDLDTLNRIHARMHRCVREAGGVIDRIVVCPSADDAHPDRKPNPGMYLQIAARFGITLNGVPAVGDSRRDLQAARAAGAQPVLVQTGKGAGTLAYGMSGFSDVPVFADLATFAKYWISERQDC